MLRLLPPVLATAAVVTVSNILVMFPVNNWLTLGAFSYPLVFLVTDLTNRLLGAHHARRAAGFGFIFALVLSVTLVDVRIGFASALAYLVGQLLDIAVFDRLRHQLWWRAPLISSVFGSATDSLLFFALAFAGTGLPWASWAIGDMGVKVIVAVTLLPAYRLGLRSLIHLAH